MKERKDTYEGLEGIIDSFSKEINDVAIGEKLLVDFGNKSFLIAYEGFDSVIDSPELIPVNRKMAVRAHRFFNPEITKERGTEREIELVGYLGIRGLRLMGFTHDEELDIMLAEPGRYGNDIYFKLGIGYEDGSIRSLRDKVEIYKGDHIFYKLSEQLPHKFFEGNVVPFLEDGLTGLTRSGNRLKSMKDRAIDVLKFIFLTRDPKDYDENLMWLESETKDFKKGDFVYVGSKEQVYVFGFNKSENGIIEAVNSDETGIRPLYFSNRAVWKQSVPLIGTGKYGTPVYAPPQSKEDFIFCSIGRGHMEEIFLNPPELITGKIDTALDHFETTDFRDFRNVILRYNTLLSHDRFLSNLIYNKKKK